MTKTMLKSQPRAQSKQNFKEKPEPKPKTNSKIVKRVKNCTKIQMKAPKWKPTQILKVDNAERKLHKRQIEEKIKPRVAKSSAQLKEKTIKAKSTPKTKPKQNIKENRKQNQIQI